MLVSPASSNQPTEPNQSTSLATAGIHTLVQIEPTPLLDQNPAVIYLATLRPTGRRAQKAALTVMAQLLTGNPQQSPFTLAWHDLRYQHTAALLAALQEKKDYKPATVNRYLCALRGVLKQAWNLGQLSAEEYHRAINLKGLRSSTLPRGRALKSNELTTLLAVCASDSGRTAGSRDAALISVLYSTGLRRSEIVKLTLADYDPAENSITVRAGKGGKDRLCYIESGTEAALHQWLRIREDQPGPLFYPITKAGKINPKHGLTDQAILWILQKRAKEGQIAAFSPHDLRRTFISDLLDAGADIVTVQKLAGHADVSTTARYDRRGETAKKKATNLLHVPYLPRPETE